jgi:hypothetical protein
MFLAMGIFLISEPLVILILSPKNFTFHPILLVSSMSR